MALKYTQTFTLTETPVAIKMQHPKGLAAGNGVIPYDVSVEDIQISALKDGTGAIPVFYIKGTHGDSTYVIEDRGDFYDYGLANVSEFCTIHAATGESIVVTIKVRGQ